MSILAVAQLEFKQKHYIGTYLHVYPAQVCIRFYMYTTKTYKYIYISL